MSSSPFLNVKQCAAFIGLSPSTVYKKACLGLLPVRDHFGKPAFHVDDLLEWSESRKRKVKVTSVSRFQAARLRLQSRSLTSEDTSTSPRLERGVG